MAHLGFDARTVEPDKGQLDPIPAGWYTAMVDESELKPTNDGLGARLAVRFSIIDGQYANRKIYTGFNIRNQNPVAQEIAFKQLSALAHAVGVLQVEDSAQLHNIPLKIRVKVVPAKDQYEAKNEPTTYKHISEDVGPKATAAGAGTPAAPGAPGAGPVIPPAPGTAAPAAPAAPAATSAEMPKQPWEQPPAAPVPPAPAAPAAPAPPPAAPVFPPEGWTPHPDAAGYFYKGTEVLNEADLRAKFAAPAAPAAPAGPDPAAVAGEAAPPWMNKG